MSDRPDPLAASSSGVVTVPASLASYLRKGVLRMLSEVALEISVLVEQSSGVDGRLYVAKMRRLDALRLLVKKVGITARGVRPTPVALTEADQPQLALTALEIEYRILLSRVEDAEVTGFNTSTRQLTELGELIATLRERLGDSEGDDAG